MNERTIVHLNPGGRFVIGGPLGDAGLTGRKCIVDSYGGWGSHGGSVFSGNDPGQLGRCGCYAARWVAKSIVAGGVAERVVVQLSYSVGNEGKESPQVFVDSYGTGKCSDTEIVRIIGETFDLSLNGIVRELDLKRPIYRQTAAYGHFGRTDVELPWERPKLLQGWLPTE
jgi:S-adenosylmethionine synthetase